MKMKHVLSAGFAVVGLGLAAAGAQAAPLVGAGSVAGSQAPRATLVEKATFFGHHHHHYYPHYRYRYYKPYYSYYYKPHYYGHKPYYYGYKPHYWRHHRHYGHW